MIISIDAEKAFDKIQQPFMIQTLQKVGIEGTFLNIIKAIYDKPTANIVLNGEQMKPSTKIRNKTRLPTLTSIIQHSVGSVSQTIRQDKEIKGVQIRKEEVKLLVFVDEVIFYIENPKDSTNTY